MGSEMCIRDRVHMYIFRGFSATFVLKTTNKNQLSQRLCSSKCLKLVPNTGRHRVELYSPERYVEGDQHTVLYPCSCLVGIDLILLNAANYLYTRFFVGVVSGAHGTKAFSGRYLHCISTILTGTGERAQEDETQSTGTRFDAQMRTCVNRKRGHVLKIACYTLYAQTQTDASIARRCTFD